MAYQSLVKYSGSMYGSPIYAGLEYDREVPDNNVVSSPGGASTTHHYHTKGFYGCGSSTPDIYAGEGRMYPYGILGNLYQYGQTSAVHQKIFDEPPDQMFTENNSTPTIAEAFEKISPPDSVESINGDVRKVRVKVNAWLLFFLLVVAYIGINFLTLSTQTYIQNRFHKGQEPSWKSYLFYALLFIGLLFLLTYFTGTSLIELETL